MLLLPGICLSEHVDPSLDVQTIRLPCPARHLLHLIVAVEQSETCGWFLRTNPAIFLYAHAGYQRRNGVRAESLLELDRWASQHLITVLASQADDLLLAARLTSKANRKLLKSIRRMGMARTRKGLHLALVRFVAATTGLKKSWVKEQMLLWLGDGIKPDQQFASQLETPQTLSGILAVWSSAMDCAEDRGGRKPSPRPSPRGRGSEMGSAMETGFDENIIGPELIGQLLRQAARLRESQAEFDIRLQTEKLAAMQQLAYGASHEINNPLANISTRAQALIRDELNPERRQKLATIYEQALRAHEMISDMMLFANPPEIKPVQTDLRLLIAGVMRDIEHTVSRQQDHFQKRINWQVRLGPNVSTANVDPDHFAVLLHSLFKNSVEAIESAGTIDIHVERAVGGRLSISVVDDGAGVSSLATRHLFDPFYSGREAGRGLGFGLSKAWRIAQLHGAALSHDAEYADGTRFVVTLPAEGSKDGIELLSDRASFNLQPKAYASPDKTYAFG